jgi:uncharacterized protein (DUF1330 family)
MKRTQLLAAAVGTAISVAVGAASATVPHAAQIRAAPGYIIAEVEITDSVSVQQYGAKVPETLAPFNARYLIRGKTTSLEGEPPKNFVVIAFDSRESAQAWYDSPAYAAIKPIRQRATKSRVFIAEGAAPK